MISFDNLNIVSGNKAGSIHKTLRSKSHTNVEHWNTVYMYV